MITTTGESPRSWPTARSLGRQRYQAQEARGDLLDHVGKAVEVGRLDDVGVRVQRVALLNIAWRQGCREHYYRNCQELRVALQSSQDIQAITDRQVKVEQDKAGVGSVCVSSPDELYRLLAITDHIKLNRRQGLLEGLPDHYHVVWVVFDEQDDGPVPEAAWHLRASPARSIGIWR